MSNYFEELEEDKYITLGKAVYAWTKLEHLIYTYLRYLSPNDQSYQLLFGRFRPINDRCKILYSFIELTSDLKEDERQELLKLISQIDKLAEDRNKIAHNPLEHWIEFGEIANPVKNSIIKGATGEPINFELWQVENFASDAQKICYDLGNLIERIIKSI